MDLKDYYDVLKVSRDATQDEIRRAYRKLARETHPDLNSAPEAEATFKSVNEAYEALKDPEARAEYDAMRRGTAGPQGAPRDWEGGFSFDQGSPEAQARFSDLFASAFGRGDPFDEARSFGGDIHARVMLDIEDSYRGATRKLSVPTQSVGADGRIVVETRDLSVRIPRGITEGQTIRLAGQGAAAGGGKSLGDIMLEVAFAPHPIYRTQGKDVFMELPISPWEAALGEKIVLPTPGGKVDLKIPRNARTGQTLRLKGKGLPGRPAGNLMASLVIVNPDVTSDESRALFAKMARDIPFDPRANFERKSK